MGCRRIGKPSSTIPSFRLGDHRKHNPTVLGIGRDDIIGADLAGENVLRQAVFQILLDGALERAGAIDRIKTGLAEQVEGGVGDLQRDVALG